VAFLEEVQDYLQVLAADDLLGCHRRGLGVVAQAIWHAVLVYRFHHDEQCLLYVRTDVLGYVHEVA
jgi:hypothetical protein